MRTGPARRSAPMVPLRWSGQQIEVQSQRIPGLRVAGQRTRAGDELRVERGPDPAGQPRVVCRVVPLADQPGNPGQQVRRAGQVSGGNQPRLGAGQAGLVGRGGRVQPVAELEALLPQAWAGRRLAYLVQAEGHHIGTGFVGTPLVCDVLCAVGEHEVAYRLLMQRESPSWLYPVTMGATTIWERWDSLLPDGSVNPGEMTSFNHYALGAVADWLHRTVAGLAPVAPGYRRILVRPRPGGGLTHAFAVHETPYGRAEVRWHIVAGQLHVDVQVPTGTTALIDLPGHDGQPIEVGSGRHQFTGAGPRTNIQDEL